MTKNQFYEVYGCFGVFISELELKLCNARKTALKQDFTEAEDRIRILKRVQDIFTDLYYKYEALDNRFIHDVEDKRKLLQKIVELETENKQLKQNIK